MKLVKLLILLLAASALFAETWIVKYEVLERVPSAFGIVTACAVIHAPGAECDYGKSPVAKFASFESKQAALDFLNSGVHQNSVPPRGYIKGILPRLFRAEPVELMEFVTTEAEPPPPPKTKEVRRYYVVLPKTTSTIQVVSPEDLPFSDGTITLPMGEPMPKRKAAPKKRTSWKMDPAHALEPFFIPNISGSIR